MLVLIYYILKPQFVPYFKRRTLLQSPDGASSLPEGAKKVEIKDALSFSRLTAPAPSRKEPKEA